MPMDTQSRLLYRDLMDSMQVGVMVQGLDTTILMANAQVQSLLDRTEEQLLGRSVYDPSWSLKLENGQPFPPAQLPVPLAIQTKRPVYNVVMGFLRPRLADRVWLRISALPMLDAQGEVQHVVVTLIDISEHKRSELDLTRSQDELQHLLTHMEAILDNMLDAVITINAHGIVETFSKAARQMFGYSAHEVVGKNIAMLMPMPHREQHDGYLAHFQRTGEARIIGMPRELHAQRKDGSLMPITLSVSKILRDGQPVFVGILRDITQRRHDEEEIRRLAFYDPLTNLPNRCLLVDRLKQAVANAARTAQHAAVMMLDLDHFKVLNDSLGHEVGDALLRQVAQRLIHCMREGDSVARLGGDEFVVLLEGLSEHAREAVSQAETVATKIAATLSHPYDLDGHSYNSTPSLGIVIFMEEHASTDDLLKRADVAMYQAKSAGRNTFRFFDPEMQALASERSTLERDIRNGLALGEFLLHYQLQFRGNGQAVGAEALVRWSHPVRGMVSPGAFIPLAEETGLILPLGRWVLETACQQLVAWSQDPATQQLKLAVNVSAAQIAQDNFVEEVTGAVQRTGANPNRLKLELTESMLAHNVEDLIVKMNAIKALGVGFSLDDFGTGYSSLSYLKRLPLNQLKIDQSFVRDLETDPNDAAISRTVVALGHSLGLNVVAEGVETAQQRDYLLNFGCDAFQGYFFAHPCPADALLRYLK